MDYKGGSALWLHPETNRREQQIIEILRVARISELTQQLHSSAIIYRLDFVPGVLDKFFSGLATNDVKRPNYVAPRSLIIKYACDKINNRNFSMESRVHHGIAKASSKGNIFPISSNYIHSEILGVTDSSNKRTYSPIGKEFSALLRRYGLQTNLVAFLGKLNPNPLQYSRDYKETIIIMEMIAGVTLRQALHISNNSLEPERTIEKFYTFYLLGLLAKRDYSHGDCHSGNILVSGQVPFITVGAGQGANDFGAYLTRNGMNTVPYIIDFGRAASLNDIKLEIFTAVCTSVVDPYYIQIYDKATKSGRTPKDLIKGYISSNNYVEAVFITTMCRYIYPSLYRFKCEMGAAMYDVFFTVNEVQARTLNALLKQAFTDRDVLVASHATAIQGGSVMRRIQYRSEKNKITPKTRKKKQIKLHKKKTRKLEN
jgi:hypothetical protein